MSVAEEVRRDVMAALKAGQRERADALRVVLAELQRELKDGRGDELAVLRREHKRRLEAAAQFTAGQREDLARKERSEAELISGYLPAQLDEAGLATLVADALRQTGARGPKDFGPAMRAVMAGAQGRVDGARASRAVKAALGD